MFKNGTGISDRFVAFIGTLVDINIAIDALAFEPNANFNSRQHVEILTVSIRQTGSEEAKVRVTRKSLFATLPSCDRRLQICLEFLISSFDCAVLRSIKVENLLPVEVYPINDPPEVLVPRHHLLTMEAFDVCNQRHTSQGTVRATELTVTLGILAVASPGRILLRGINNHNVTKVIDHYPKSAIR